MAIKRKAVTQGAQKLFKGSKADLEEAVEEEVEKEEQGTEEPEQEDVEEETAEETPAQVEKKTVDARKKELKSMSADKLKNLMSSHDLEPGNRNHNMDKIVAHEAKLRKAQRDKDNQIRAVVASKKEELEGLASVAFKKMCDEAGVKGKSKTDRIEELMRVWQEADGVDKALLTIAQDKRHEVLSGMATAALLKMCRQADLDPYVKDVMVARIVRKEYEAGQFARPMPMEQADSGGSSSSSSSKQSVDMIDDFLAKEAKRKKALELKKQQDDAAAKKIAELKNMPVDKLKKLVAQNGLDNSGVRTELIVALVKLDQQKAAVEERRQEFKAMGKDGLTALAVRKGVTKGSVDAMVTGLIEAEDKHVAELAAYETKLDELLLKKKAEFGGMSATALKVLCTAKGVKAGTGKDGRVENLVNATRDDDEMHDTLAKMARDSRKAVLLGLEKAELLKLCEELGADPHVPKVMVELLMEREIESGSFRVKDEKEPAAKKARTSK